MAGQEDDRDLRVPEDGLGGLDPVDLAVEEDVHEDEGGGLAGHGRDGFLARGDDAQDLIPELLQSLLHVEGDDDVVLDEEDAGQVRLNGHRVQVRHGKIGSYRVDGQTVICLFRSIPTRFFLIFMEFPCSAGQWRGFALCVAYEANPPLGTEIWGNKQNLLQNNAADVH